jgi:hypothetical protein
MIEAFELTDCLLFYKFPALYFDFGCVYVLPIYACSYFRSGICTAEFARE